MPTYRLAVVAERLTHDHAWQHPARKCLRFASCCDGHLAGELGVKVLATLQARQALSLTAKGYAVTTSVKLNFPLCMQCSRKATLRESDVLNFSRG